MFNGSFISSSQLIRSPELTDIRMGNGQQFQCMKRFQGVCALCVLFVHGKVDMQ
jgi:hypothetical protein